MMTYSNSNSNHCDPQEPLNHKTELDNNGVTQKEPGAFRTISEVADEIHVPQHVLRFWETRFAQLQPIKRSGGRRYYRTEDIILLKYISELLYVEGYTIKGVQRLLKEDFSRFNKKKAAEEKAGIEENNAQSTIESVHDVPDENKALLVKEDAAENVFVTKKAPEEQNDGSDSAEQLNALDKLRKENSFLVDSLKTVLVELQELRKMIINS